MNRAAARSKPPAADRRKLLLYATLAVVVIAIVVGVGLASRVPKAASDAPMLSKLKAGDHAPTFTAATNAGPFDLAQVSTPVLLEVFATWCPHCQRETAVLDALAGKYAGKLAIVAVSGSAQAIDGTSPETLADVNAFGAKFDAKYPLAFDPELNVAQLYLQGGFPTLVVIDRAKKVRFIKSGEVSLAELTTAINKTI